MALEDVFTLSPKKMVLYEVGKFGNDRTSPKFIKAPFDLVNVIGAGLCLCPISTKRARAVADSGTGNDTANEAFKLSGAGDEFFLDREIIVVGEHEMGDYKGQPENWKGMHKFSQI